MHKSFAKLVTFFALTASAFAQNEPFRPQFHFSPEKNWMNDPNGMVFYEGEWHLFYQYNPHGNTWGHMSWGHAVSRDLTRWEHLPLALAEEDGIMIFSGSAVVDWKNTSGFGRDGKPPLVAIYTGHRQGRQDQRIAYSNDRGRTWTKYEGNPVLDLKMADFRDPKVSWHEPTRRWVMVVALPLEKKVHFYASVDLKRWEFAGEFGPAGGLGGMWECPDLFQAAVEGGNSTKWVLIVNINPGGPAGGSGCQYFVGDFDGKRFVEDPVTGRQPEFVPNGRVIADFENGYGNWKVEGEAFGNEPARGTLPNQQPVTGFKGRGLINSYRGGDSATGILTSPQFEIDANHISFLIGGGAGPETRVDLIVDGKAVRSMRGSETEQLVWQSWNVREFRGKQAKIQAVDQHTGGWGHINLDHFILADEPARSANEPVRWADFGPDFYAAVSWSDVPKEDGRRIWLGWMSNWRYADKVPTHPWRSAMTVPRVLTLRPSPEGLKLVQRPVAELARLRKPNARRFEGGSIAAANEWLKKQSDLPPLLEMEVELDRISTGSSVTLRLHTGSDEFTAIRIDGTNSRIAFDRTQSGKTDFHPEFPGRHEAPLRIQEERVTLRLLLDTSSIEIFAQDGETVLTELIFPQAGSRALTIQSEKEGPEVRSILIHDLKPAR